MMTEFKFCWSLRS